MYKAWTFCSDPKESPRERRKRKRGERKALNESFSCEIFVVGLNA